MQNVRVHPFDLDFHAMGLHRQHYTCPKGSRGAVTTPKASLEAVFLSLSQKIHLHAESWKQILRQFDQSSF